VRRTLLGLGLLCVLLAGARGLLRDDAGARAHAPRLVRLRDAARPGATTVAGVSVEDQRGSVLFARSRGVWRCLSAWGAPGDGERIEGLVRALLGAQGVVRAEAPRDGVDYGLSGPEALELILHGKQLLDDPAGDELLRVRVGAASRVTGSGAVARSGSFACVAPSPRVLELDLDPRAWLDTPAPGLPPLLDARLAPGDFPGPGRRVERVFLDRADGTTLELVRRPREARAPGEGVSAAETLDWEWLLLSGERQEVIPPLRGEAWVTWAPRAPYVGLADPSGDEALGLDAPQARLTLVPDEGEPLELVVGRSTSDGAAWVDVPSVPLRAAVAPQTLAMLLPDADELAEDARRNRWDEALLEALSATRR
jgi:hypothetical protein